MNRCLEESFSSRVAGVAAAVMVAVAGVVFLPSSVAVAEVRTLEVVGTVSIDPTRVSSVVPRDAAIEQALREAVFQVAKEFLADRPIDGPGDDEIDPQLNPLVNQDPRGSPTRTGPGRAISSLPKFEPDSPDLYAILGKKMVPYTLRFRVMEDRGQRPALFSDDPNVSQEYMVIVEVQVDVDRIRAKLVSAGLLLASENLPGSNEVRLEIEGLTLYPAYLAMRELLEGPLGVTGVFPVEMGRDRIILDVETRSSAVEFLEQMLLLAPRAIQIVPVGADGNRVQVVVNWVSDLAEGVEDRSPRP